MIDLIIASLNNGKIKEYQNALAKLPIKVKSLLDFSAFNEIEETGKTFKENAIIKAKSVFKRIPGIVLADDSGLVVNSLPNELGVKSKRFSSSQSDEDNIDLLLRKIKDKDDRSAYFICVIAIIINEKTIKTYQGKTTGKIIEYRQGSNGFGYDPVFLVDGANKTYAEMTLEEKQEHSHRGKAIKAMLEDKFYETINL
jgi:XTP/dITP diphosphohydrolase